MIPLHRALELVDAAAGSLEVEEVALADALGRFLARPIVAPFDIPPFAKSAMDGFAVRSADVLDLERPLHVTEVVPAGKTPNRTVEQGTAAQIMTGAPIPAGADVVIRVEYAVQEGSSVRFQQKETSSNIITRGENARAGDELVPRRRLGVHDIGVAASVGLATVPVFRRPRIGIISTGDEIHEPGTSPAHGSIFNSNAYQLYAHAQRAGYAPSYYGIAADHEQSLRDHLNPAFAENEVIVLSGGVSKGSFDYVPGVLEELGVQTVFHRVAVKPGRPTLYGTRLSGDTVQHVFGLPGNPVSTFVMFELFAVRLLNRMCGLEPPRADLCVRMGETIEKRDSERTEFIPVVVSEGTATPVHYAGSSHLNALSRAHALLELPMGVTVLEKGSTVYVRPL